jgi:cell division protein FtsB
MSEKKVNWKKLYLLLIFVLALLIFLFYRLTLRYS